MHIENQERCFIDEHDRTIVIPILWGKHADSNGAFSWVSVAGNGEVVEYERQAYYDYVNGRGKTEQWTTDDWLLQHKSLLFDTKLTASQKRKLLNLK